MTDTPFIDLIRHGEVNGPQALYGWTDPPMSAAGWACFAPLFAPETSPYALVVTSPLRRCAAVADRLADHYGVTVRTVSDVQEMNFGDWDGVPFAQVNDQWEAMGRFRAAPRDHPPPRGETLPEMCHRVLSGWETIKSWAGDHGSVLVLCHGGPIRIIIADILGADIMDGRLFRCLAVPHASRTRIRLTAGDAVLEHVAQLL